MSAALTLTALLMGVAGGPHCVAMCGAACGGIVGPARGPRRMALFQLGRAGGYAALGLLAGASMQGLGWLGTNIGALRPAWTLFHAGALALGLSMLVLARQPLWLGNAGTRVFQVVRSRVPGGSGDAGVLAMGSIWALMPCGLLYSALLLAAMAGGAVAGASVMLAFALGSGAVLAMGPWLWRAVRGAPGDGRREWGSRLAGLALAAVSAWALWGAHEGPGGLWCIDPISPSAHSGALDPHQAIAGASRLS